MCHSDLRRTGWFECSDERVNRLHENVVWGMRGNFLDVPTDCPQRDERLGWTGDLTAFAPSACFLYDVAGFLTSWLADLAAEQTDDLVPLVVPNVLGDMPLRTALWGDAATEVPWTAYQRYGDQGLLEAQYPSMRRWLETILAHCDAPGHWEEPFHLGDWLDPAAPPDNAAGRAHRRGPGGQRLVLPHRRAHGRGGRAARRGRSMPVGSGTPRRPPGRTSPPATCAPTEP